MSDIFLLTMITIIFIYSLSLYKSKVLCQLLWLGISWNLLDKEFEMSMTILQRSLKYTSNSRICDRTCHVDSCFLIDYAPCAHLMACCVKSFMPSGPSLIPKGKRSSKKVPSQPLSHNVTNAMLLSSY